MSEPQTVSDVIYWCRSCVPCGVPLDLAIDAHKQAAKQPNKTVRWYTLRTIIMACCPDVEADRKRLDYMADLPLEAWAEFEKPEVIQRDTLDMLRRQIAWQTVHA